MLARQSNRKWQRRPKLYRGRFFYWRHVAFSVVGASLLVACLSLFLFFQRSGVLTIRHIQVVGSDQRVSREQIVQLAKIQSDDRLFAVSLSGIEQNILRHPWVAAVQLRREFPDTLQIVIQERNPVARLRFARQDYLIAHDGVIFKKWEAGDGDDLAIVSGFDENQFRQYPALSRQEFAKTFSILQDVQQTPILDDQRVIELKTNVVRGVTLVLQDHKTKAVRELYLGHQKPDVVRGLMGKFKLSQWRGQMWSRLDVSRDGRWIIKSNELR